jgi:hypothetical protein
MPPTIRDWSLLHVGTFSDRNVDRASGCHGVAFGHPRFVDGTHVVTSSIVSIDSAAGVLHTATRSYCLGASSAGYTALRRKHGLDEHIQLLPSSEQRHRTEVKTA